MNIDDDYDAAKVELLEKIGLGNEKKEIWI